MNQNGNSFLGKGIKSTEMVSLILMAESQHQSQGSSTQLPGNLSELCQFLGTTIENVVLPCFFCHKALGYLDKIIFMHSDLTIYWQNNTAHGTCYACIAICCKIEFVTFFERYAPVAEIEQRFGCNFVDLPIRCITCLRPLTRIEKTDIRDNAEHIFIIGGLARAQCMICRIGF